MKVHEETALLNWLAVFYFITVLNTEQWKAGHKQLTRHERIMLYKQQNNVQNRHTRRLEKFSERFKEMFNFFLNSYRSGILTFAGELVEVDSHHDGYSGRETFRRFDDGQFKTTRITSRHSNIVKAVIAGKKSWGLWLNEYAKGIAECSFTKSEILETFERKGIKIPEPLMIDFENRIYKRRLEYYNRTK